jgi:dienelactone hydrolase
MTLKTYFRKPPPWTLHGFSNPAADERGKKFNLPLAYNENADRKSWEAMKTLFERVL